MRIMQSWDWLDDYIERVNSEYGSDKLEIVFKKECSAILISKADVVELTKEFDLIVYEKKR